MPHLITDIAVTPSVEDDRTALPEIQERQQQRNALPGERYVDKGYTSGPNLASSAKYGEELLGPLSTPSTPQSRMQDGLTLADFQIDLEARQVRCPNGQTARLRRQGKQGWRAQFAPATWAGCPLRARCCTGRGGGGRGRGAGLHFSRPRRRARAERRVTH